MRKAAHEKNCTICKRKFMPKSTLAKVCSISCAIVFAQKAQEKKRAKELKVERCELREAKEKLKTKGQHTKEAQIVFNSLRRAQCHGMGCISCGSFTGKMNAGHYRSEGSMPQLRFTTENVWLQCELCNSYLSGNLINYRINLVTLIGVERVEWLEGHHEPLRWSIDTIKAFRQSCRDALKELKKKSDI